MLEPPWSAGYRCLFLPIPKSGSWHPPNSASAPIASIDGILPREVSPSFEDGIPQTERHESPRLGRISVKANRLRDDAVTDRVQDKFGRVVQVKLLKDMRAVGLDGGQAHAQQRRDLLVAVAFGDQLKDFPLPL